MYISTQCICIHRYVHSLDIDIYIHSIYIYTQYNIYIYIHIDTCHVCVYIYTYAKYDVYNMVTGRPRFSQSTCDSMKDLLC